MEENISDALHIGVSVFMFVAAISASLLLMQNISKMSELSLESLGKMDSNILERNVVPAAYVVTGSEVISYYSNFVMPENDQFEFYLDRAAGITVSDTQIGLNSDYKPPIDPEPFVRRCNKLTPGDDASFDRLANSLTNYFIKVVRKEGNITRVYFISAGNSQKRAEAFMYCLAGVHDR